MAAIMTYLITMLVTYLVTQFSQKVMWKHKKQDGTDKQPWPISPRGLPYFTKAYAIFEREGYLALTRWSEQLGEFFSVQIGWKRILVVNSAELAQKVLVEKDQYNASRLPSDTFESTMTDQAKTVFSAPFSLYWSRLRRAIHIVLNAPHALDEVHQTQAKLFSQQIGTAADRETLVSAEALRELVDLLAADTALTMLLGPQKRTMETLKALVDRRRALEALQTDRYSRWCQFYPVFNKLMDVYRLFTLDSRITRARNALLEIFLDPFETFFAQRDAILATKQHPTYQAHSPVATLAQSLLSIDPSKNDPEPEQLTKEEMVINLAHLAVHAQTYLATTLFSLIQRLASEPEWQTRLLENHDLAAAFVNECLRLDVPNPLLAYAPRTDYDFQSTDGHTYRVDTDSEFVINVHAIHQNPRYYPQPAQFAPERFTRSEKKTVSLMKQDLTGKKVANDHLAFGAGRRICLGRKTSERFLIALLLQLLQTYTLQGGNPSLKKQVLTSGWSWTGRTETLGDAVRFIRRSHS
ncbi:cytochrome P450 [Sporodiniella umbellata]|nr:cytochrome P450 [Sporodiniella umbellata]